MIFGDKRMGTMIPIPRSQRLTKNSAYEAIVTASRSFPENVIQEEDWERDTCIFNHCNTWAVAVDL